MNDLIISLGTSRLSTNWERKSVTWEQLAKRLIKVTHTQETAGQYATMTKDEQVAIKDIGGFVGGELIGVRRTGTSVKNRCLLCLDVDYGDQYVIEDWDTYLGYAAVIHTTHSHVPNKPRYRIIAPLKRVVNADEYELIARTVAHDLGMDRFDSTTFQPSRLMFWPSCPSDITPIAEKIDGKWLDPDRYLSRYEDWHDVSKWPRCKKEDRDLHRSLEKAEDPRTKPGWIGAFCKTYTISDAIRKFIPEVYTQVSDTRWTFNAGHTVGGAVVYEHDTFLYSWHDTDPAHLRCCNAYDLVRIHLFGKDDENYTGDWKNQPSQLKMQSLCREDQDCFREYTAALVENNPGIDPEIEGERFKGDMTDQGYALKFVDTYGQNFRYSPHLGWLFWTGKQWLPDAEAYVWQLLDRFNDDHMRAAHELVAKAGENEEQLAYAREQLKLAAKMRSTAQHQKIIEKVRKIPKVFIPDVQSLDANPWDLNTPDGIIDLRTGEIRPNDPATFCTRITSVGVADASNPQMWQDFMSYITGGDVNVEDFLQRAIGMAAVGAVYEEGAFFSYGKGSNGKSTFYGAILDILNDYATVVSPDMLIRERGQHANIFASSRLLGRRLVLMSETEAGAYLSVSALKQITSKDDIPAQKKFKDEFTFRPSHTTIIQTNNLPNISHIDKGLLRRITVVEFPTTITPENVITNYRDQLVARCGSDILKWITEGAVKFYNAGCKLQKPERVLATTASYVEEEDSVGEFIRECCRVGDNYSELSKRLYDAYCDYADRIDGKQMSSTAFGKRLKQDFVYRHTERGREYAGLELKG